MKLKYTDIQTKNMNCQDCMKKLSRYMKKKSSDNSDPMKQNISILEERWK